MHDRVVERVKNRKPNRALRAACRNLLQSLHVTPPLAVMDLVGPIGNLRGRPIRLVEHPLTEGLAVSFSLPDTDVIAWRAHTSAWHRDHSLAHELGHVLCGHLDGDDPDYGGYNSSEADDIARIVASFGGGEQANGHGIRRRLCYDDPQEHAVEFIATTFLEWSIVPGRAPTHLSGELGASNEIYRTLSYHRGWM